MQTTMRPVFVQLIGLRVKWTRRSVAMTFEAAMTSHRSGTVHVLIA